jgi:hypothetical protein
LQAGREPHDQQTRIEATERGDRRVETSQAAGSAGSRAQACRRSLP